MNTATPEEVVQSVFSASPENRYRALLILQGNEPEAQAAPLDEPLLLGMGQAAKLMGLSRSSLWRLIKSGRLEKIELYTGSYRIRKSDILALIAESGVRHG